MRSDLTAGSDSRHEHSKHVYDWEWNQKDGGKSLGMVLYDDDTIL